MTDTSIVPLNTMKPGSSIRSALDGLGLVGSKLFRVDPVSEGRWIAETRERRGQQLSGRDWTFSVVAALLFVAFALVAALTLGSDRSVTPFEIALIVGAYALAASVEFEVGPGSAVPTELILVPMLFVLPLGLVPACVGAGLLLADVPRYIRREAHPQRAVPALMSAWHCAGPVAVLAAFGETSPALSHWPVYVAALACQFAVDFVVSTSRARFAFGTPPLTQLSAMASVWAVDVALAPIGLFVAIAAVDYRYAFLAAVPLILLIGVFARERTSRIDNALELSHAYRGTALLLGDMIEADDHATGTHSRDVVSLVLGVAERMGLDGRVLRDAEFAALLHDVGKVRVPNEIVNKPGQLTDLEWLVIKQHTVWGEEMLKAVGGILGDIGAIVRSCHERYDGTGYPDGLAGDEIPLIARIIFVCDTFSAITSDRSYRKARSTTEALVELRRHAGTQFDPAVVEMLIAIVADEESGRPIPLHPVTGDDSQPVGRAASN